MYTRDELTPDGLHPNDKGHRLVAEKVTSFLDEVKVTWRSRKKRIACPRHSLQTHMKMPEG